MSGKLIACMSPEVIKRRVGEEIVTLDCKISLTRKEWSSISRKLYYAAQLDRIGMVKAGIEERIIAQIVAQHMNDAK